jgi:large subunit ribosomal protein L29
MSKHSATLTAFRDHSDEELRQQLATNRDELFRMQLGSHTNQVTSTAGLTTKRRDIARLMTILNGRAAGIEKQAEKTATTAEAAPADSGSKKQTKKTSKKKAE